MDRQLKQKHVVAMSLPGWLIRKGGRIGQKYADNQDSQEFLKLTQYIKKLRFLVIENELALAKNDIDQLLQSIRDDGFERYLNVKSKGERVHVMVQEKENIIRHLLVLVYEPDQLVMVKMKMNLPVSQFDALNFDPKYEEL